MRKLALFVEIVLVCIFQAAAVAQQLPEAFQNEAEVYRAFGPLPNRGSLSDVLDCAAANAVLWTTVLKRDPRSVEAHEAKRKAGWYSAVALWVFAVDSQVVLDAVRAATSRIPRQAVFDLAQRCRKAPGSWRE